jgi:hypothetical protein
MIRSLLIGLIVAATATTASAQKKDETKEPPKADPIPAPAPRPMPPAPAPMAQPLAQPTPVAPPAGVSPGTHWFPYQPQKYPVPGQVVIVPGNAYAYLPARAVYGPAASPLDYPYHAFVPGYPYPGYTVINPYPRTVSSYSYGPTRYPLTGRLYR